MKKSAVEYATNTISDPLDGSSPMLNVLNNPLVCVNGNNSITIRSAEGNVAVEKNVPHKNDIGSKIYVLT